MCARNEPEYQAMDLISDILSRGNSARLYNKLVKEDRIFSEVSAFVMGDSDKGTFVVSGKVNEGVSTEAAEESVFAELKKLQEVLVPERELQKVKNKVESSHLFAEMGVLDKSMNLAFYELMGDAELVNTELNKYMKVTSEEIRNVSKEVFRKTNCSTLHYKRKTA